MSNNSLYLIDGTSLCYRSFYAINLSTAAGFPTGAIYGVYRMLTKLVSLYKPDYMAMCFDVSRKTFRSEKFKEYKINRRPLPDALGLQLPRIRGLVEAMGIAIVEKQGYEADDVIASLCQKALENKFSVVIVSSDKDLYQLLETGSVSILNQSKDALIDKRGFIDEFGFKPGQIIDYLSLAGDASDNIPGAKGIGKVTAAQLIKDFESVENLFDNLDKVKPKTQNILEKSKKEVFLSKELITLSPCALDLSWDDLRLKTADSNVLYQMFSEFEFKGLLKDMVVTEVKDIAVCQRQNVDFVKDFGEAIFFFIYGSDMFFWDNPSQSVGAIDVKRGLKILNNSSLSRITYDAKSQVKDTRRSIFGTKLFDIKIAAYVLDASLSDYSMQSLSMHYLKENIGELEARFYPYYIKKLYDLMNEELKGKGLEDLFFGIEMPLVEVLADMQIRGAKIDASVLQSLLVEVDKRAELAQRGVYAIAKKEFNLNSPKQMQEVLFKDLKIKPLKKTKTGFSTNEEVLVELALSYPIAEKILEYRYLNKLKNTYIVPIAQAAEKNLGFLHAGFHQTSTQTGRLSSSAPNLQSVPAKGELSDWLRSAFVPSFDDGCLLSGDYSQIELRILAHLSNDSTLIKAFKEGVDIHKFTAGLLFDIGVDAVSDQQRNVAKRINFGIVYGMSSYGLSRELDMSPGEAQNFIDDYFRRYQGVKNYIDSICEQALERGYVQTIMGRRRGLSDINSSNIHLREFARRQAVNTPIQGSCADLIKIAMVRIFQELRKRKLRSRMVVQIHDELVFDVPRDELEEVKALVKEYMEKALPLDVPVTVNLKVGNNWGTMSALV